MDDKKIAEYFIVAGLPPDPQPLEEISDETAIKSSHKQDPIVDITVINKTLGEVPPHGFHCVEFTPNGFPADLNHGSIRAHELNVCYRRGRDRPPLTDIGILLDNKEGVKPGCEMVLTTPQGHSANVNNSSNVRIFITFRRAPKTAPVDTLAVMDICVILANKSEVPPHTFFKIDKNLNKGMVGSDVFLCYKKSMSKNFQLVYKPAFLDRYPPENQVLTPLPERVPMFCLPLGASLESWPANSRHPSPQFSTFVLTMEAWDKLYGASVSFYEEMSEENLTKEQRKHLGLDNEDTDHKEHDDSKSIPSSPTAGSPTARSPTTSSPTPSSPTKDSPSKQNRTVHVSKAICILSRWPFFQTFKRYLSYVYHMSISGPHEVPLERVISHFLHEVPFPSPQRPRILVQFSNTAISLSQPEESPLSQSGASFVTLLKNLSADHCVTLMLLTLMENKILLHSLRHAVLTSVAEAVSHMIFPLHWQCPYIPLCPLELSGVLSAPTPFLVGMDSRYFDLFDPPSDVVCIDLDANTITLPDEKKSFTAKMMPKKATKALRSTLEKLCIYLSQLQLQLEQDSGVSLKDALENFELEFNRKRKELVAETLIQEAFLRFMASLLKGYSGYLLPIVQAPTCEATDLSSLFDVQGFVKSRERANREFYTNMLRTQTFTRFIEERSFVSDKDASLAFFDECIDKVSDDMNEPRLLELEGGENSGMTVFIPPPDANGLPASQTYTYHGFPKLNPELFLQKPSMLNPAVSKLKTGQAPNSPMTKRTKQEVKSAQRTAQKQQTIPALWAKCLLSNCYSLWFIHLPSFVKCMHSKNKSLRTAYDVLLQMQSAKLQPPDEVCYRVLLQLCGVYHQPALAVKVLFEMRNTGIQPNAITYGYYNKAVLESKWPSSDTNAYQLWNKVRHVVQALAQFKQALRSRRHSMYSEESGESSDRVSRTSADSFLEEGGAAMYNTHGTHASHVYERQDTLRNTTGVDSPNDERISTGGLSDKGYSSMTLDDKRSSLLIGSQDSLDSLSKLKAGGGGGGVVLRRHGAPHSRSSTGGGSVSHGEAIDAKTDTEFQEKIGSIVRTSTTSVGSNGTLRSSTCSSAGLLMTSECSLEESVFHSPPSKGRASLSPPRSSQSQSPRISTSGPPPPQSPSEQHVPGSRPSLTTAVPEEAGRPIADEDAGIPQAETQSADGVDRNQEKCSCGGEESGQIGQGDAAPIPCQVCVQKTEKRDDTNACSLNSASEKIGRGDSCVTKSIAQDGTASGKNEHLNVNQSENSRSEETAVDSTADTQSGNENTASNDLDMDNDIDTKKQSIFKPPMKSSSVDNSAVLSHSKPHPLRKSSVDRLSQSSSGSLKSLTSPAHSIRTPVTENDPLGMFNNSSIAPGTDSSSSSIASSNVTSSSSTMMTSSRLFSSTGNMSGSSAERFKQQQPFSNTTASSTPIRSLFRRDSGATSSDQSDSNMSLERPLSSSDNNLLDSNATQDSIDRGRSSTLPVNHSSGPRGGFGRNEGFMRSMRSAAGGWLSRIKENTVGAPSKDQAEESENMTPELGGLRRAISVPHAEPMGMPDTVHLLANMEESGSKRGRLRKLTSGTYTPFVSDFLVGVMKSPAVKSVQKGLVSMKDTIVDSWAIDSGSDDSDDYFRAEYDTENADYTDTPTGSAPPHSVLDEYVLASEGSGSGGQFGSIQSLQSAFFNTAIEVEICSLSRCVSCCALLYDEEIMAGWSSDDSNLNTTCQFCGSKVVPKLQIHVKDMRECTEPHVVRASQSLESFARSHPHRPGPGDRSKLHAVPFHASESNLPTPLTEEAPSPAAHTNHLVTPSHRGTAARASVDLGAGGDGRPSDVGSGKLGKASRSAEDLLDSSICDVVDDTPVPRMGRVSRTSTVKALEINQRSPNTSGTSSLEASPAHRPTGLDTIQGSTTMAAAQNSDDTGEEVDSGVHAEPRSPHRMNGTVLEPISVPYLSPLVLRKELETVIGSEGDLCLIRAEFVDEHPIIYWNLLWYFKRLEVTSHLPGLILTAKCTNHHVQTPSLMWAKADSRHVQIRAVWDNLRVQDSEIGKPMYITYFHVPVPSETVNALISEVQVFSKATLQHVVSCIMYNEVLKPIRLIMKERRKQKQLTSSPIALKARFRSLYRDVLFLALVVLGRDNIDHDAFDREFRMAYSQLTKQELNRLRNSDRPPNRATICCRKVFGLLEL